jgi:hypothetical protein
MKHYSLIYLRSYIFTDWEREIINTYLKEGKKLQGFTVLRKRIKNVGKILAIDMPLLAKLYLKERLWEKNPQFNITPEIMEIIKGLSQIDVLHFYSLYENE